MHRVASVSDDLGAVGSEGEALALTVSHDKSNAGFLMRSAAWCGLLVGMIEVSILAVQRFYLHQPTNLSPHFVWMTPLANLLLFVIAGLTLVPVARFWPRLASPRIAIFVFALLGFLNLLLMYERLQHYAALLLAAGLAFQTARIITAHPTGFHRLVARSLVWLLVLIPCLAALVYGSLFVRERRALAGLPEATTGAPNVLVITLDAVRAHNLSVYGYGRETSPQLKRMAERGVVFDRALSTAPWTLPSHASMFTGRYAHELSTGYTTPLDGTYPTLAEFLRARGYATAGFVANYRYCGYESGLQRGFIHYKDYPVSWGEIVSSSRLTRMIGDNFRLRRLIRNDEHLNRKSAAQINDEVLDWLSTKRKGPFFVFLNYFDAHGPYLPPSPFDTKFGPGRALGKYSALHHWLYDPAVAHQTVSKETIQEEVNAYDGVLAYLDEQLGFLFDELKKRDLMDNTLVIITADHGEEFGEHGLFDHGYSLYFNSLHVPLLIVFPGHIPAGVRAQTPVSLRDLSATVVDLLDYGQGSPFPGRSLARYWDTASKQESPEAEPLLSEVDRTSGQPAWFPTSRGDMKAVAFQHMRLIKNGDGVQEYYDFYQDPWEKQNLAESEVNREARQQLELLLKNKVR